MTIMNVHLERDRAIVTANTELLRENGSIAYGHKIFHLPHVNCVVAGRGSVDLIINVFCQAYSLLQDFDGLAAQWDLLMSHIVTGLHAMPANDLRYTEAGVVLVGWSKARQQMVCYYTQVEADGAMELHEAIGGIFMPWDASWGATPTVALDPSSCLELAQQQAELGEKHYPGKCWHGDLTIVEMGIDSTTVSTVREFWKALARDPEAVTL